MKITKEQERSLPSFINHRAARMFFKDIFGSSFLMVSTEYKGNAKIHYYHLVYDKDAYLEAKASRAAGNALQEAEYKECYQKIEISEYGDVRVIY